MLGGVQSMVMLWDLLCMRAQRVFNMHHIGANGASSYTETISTQA